MATMSAVLAMPGRFALLWRLVFAIEPAVENSDQGADQGHRMSQPPPEPVGVPDQCVERQAAITMKSPLPEISTSMVHALKLGSQTIQCLRQHRSAADGQPFRNHDAL